MCAPGRQSPRAFTTLCRLLDVLDDYTAAQGGVALDQLLQATSSQNSTASSRICAAASRRARPASARGGSLPLVRFSACTQRCGLRQTPRCRSSPFRRTHFAGACARSSRSPLRASYISLLARIAATVARCRSDLDAEHGGFRPALAGAQRADGSSPSSDGSSSSPAPATLAKILVRRFAGEALGSSTSCPMMSRRATRCGTASRDTPRSIYTIPKPFTQAVTVSARGCARPRMCSRWASLAVILACALRQFRWTAASAVSGGTTAPPSSRCACRVLWREQPTSRIGRD